jgi:hypothetical protein
LATDRPALRFPLVLVTVLAAALTGCRDDAGTDLAIEVTNGFGVQHYVLRCDPVRGDVPRPAELCRLLGAKTDLTLVRPRDNSTCIGGVETVHLRVRGTFGGRDVDAEEIDACQGNPEAERLWLSELPPPPRGP